MARPREFDEETVLDAAMRCFWDRGYQATSVRDLVDKTGITGASLYNAFGDKRALYRKALDRYVDRSIADRLQRCAKLAPRKAIGAFLAEILKRSLGDREHKGCLLVNAAVEVALHDPEFQEEIADVSSASRGSS
jgi:TetR/AcrR family transcriptional regulator, transcriptional repressor for nem operon